ncbi:MAG: NUDIX domain-containing protein, partial [Dehalococcoidia bacterium]
MTPGRPGPGSYCPDCGSRLSDEERPTCSGCGFVLYRNPIVGVAVIVRDGQGRVLLGRRASGPYRGLWCIPCGYVEYDEDLRDAAVRELREETGLHVRTGPVFAVHSNFHRPEKQTVGIWFEGVVMGGELHPVDGEFTELAYVPPASPPPLAFPTDGLVMEELAGAGRRPHASHHPLLPLAYDVATSAGALIRRLREKGLEDVATKSSDVDLVTNVDRASEDHIVGLLLTARPDDG